MTTLRRSFSKYEIELAARRKALEQRLDREGWKCKERERFDKRIASGSHNPNDIKESTRFCYEKGGWKILIDTNETPWWTVQKVVDKHVEYFVDFPQQIGIDTLFKFMEIA